MLLVFTQHNNPLVGVYWMEQDFLLHCVFRTSSEDSFSVLFSPKLCWVHLSLENVTEVEKLNYSFISQKDSTYCTSSHPKSSLDTLHSKEIVIPCCGNRELEKKNEGEGSSLPLNDFIPKPRTANSLLDNTR